MSNNRVFLIIVMWACVSCLNAQHFTPVWEGNPYMAMNIHVVEAIHDGANLQPGDEIGVFDGDICVGAAVLDREINVFPNHLEIKASMDDPGTPDVDGFTSNHPITYKFWIQSTQTQIEVVDAAYFDQNQAQITDQLFAAQGTAIVKLNAGLDTNEKPTVLITSPADGQEFSTPNITVMGTSNDTDGNVVEVQLKLNNGSYKAATGTTNWTKDLILVEGQNKIYARARDDDGAWSDEVQVQVTYMGVIPLLDTRWGQRNLYTRFSPDNLRLGCWSTAIAQILYFHRLTPSGQVNYVGSLGYTINENLDLYDFNWDLFVNELNENTPNINVEEVARYIYFTSVVIQKDFGTGSYVLDHTERAEAVANHYNCLCNLYKETNYSIDQIKQMIIQELDSERPVMLHLRNLEHSPYHAVVIDAYKIEGGTIYVHLNMGWEGVSDGWYDFHASILDYNDDSYRRISESHIY